MLSSREELIIEILRTQQPVNIQGILQALAKNKIEISKATLNRDLDNLEQKGFVLKTGQGKATKYVIRIGSTFQIPIDIDNYFEKGDRTKSFQFNNEIFAILEKITIFSDEEEKELRSLHKQYQTKTTKMQKGLLQKEFERLTIDLSWKSSKIEGNTYSLLETATLLLDGVKAKGKPEMDAQMILNHKAAIDYVNKHKNDFTSISINSITKLHSILIDKLPVANGIRKSAVGISGTNYEPLSSEIEIRKSLSRLCDLINSRRNYYEKAFLLLIMISYIQAFIDGNKRTARMLCNAVLIANGSYPISFKNTDIGFYRKAIVLFYEINNFHALKNLFIEQYKFAGKEYFHLG